MSATALLLWSPPKNQFARALHHQPQLTPRTHACLYRSIFFGPCVLSQLFVVRNNARTSVRNPSMEVLHPLSIFLVKACSPQLLHKQNENCRSADAVGRHAPPSSLASKFQPMRYQNDMTNAQQTMRAARNSVLPTHAISKWHDECTADNESSS